MPDHISINYATLERALLAGALLGDHIWRNQRRISLEAAICKKNDVPLGGYVKNSAVTLTQIAIKADFDGFYASWQLQQSYRNSTGQPQEIVYTFPLEDNFTLRGASASIDGVLYEARILPDQVAQKIYEKRASNGDLAILAQKSSSGLYTINLGNLNPGSALTLTLRLSSLANYDGQFFRHALPLGAYWRYDRGRPKNHEEIFANPVLRIPVKINLRIRHPETVDKVLTPGNSFESKYADGSWRIFGQTPPNHDLIVEILPKRIQALATYIKYKDKYFLLAFTPFGHQPKQPLNIKILVDCSGSMKGEKNRLAKSCLNALLPLLDEQDRFSFSRFGTDTWHLEKNMRKCSGNNLSRLKKAINATCADLGATCLEEACLETITGIPVEKSANTCLLLLTDSCGMDMEKALDTAIRHHHKIHILGIGSDPEASPLRKLACKSGGGYVSITYGKDIEAAMESLHEHMGVDSPWPIEWGVETQWQSNELFPFYLAVSNDLPSLPPSILSPSGKIAINDWIETSDKNLALVIANRQIQAASPQVRKELSMLYQLPSDQASFVMEIKNSKRAVPRLEYVPQMLAQNSTFPGINMFAKCGLVANYCASGIIPAKISLPENKTELLRLLLEEWQKSIFGDTPLTPASLGKKYQSIKNLLDSIETPYSQENIFLAFIAWGFGLKDGSDWPRLSRHETRMLKSFSPKAEDLEELFCQFDSWRLSQ